MGQKRRDGGDFHEVVSPRLQISLGFTLRKTVAAFSAPDNPTEVRT